jgi:hypothetical protein
MIPVCTCAWMSMRTMLGASDRSAGTRIRAWNPQLQVALKFEYIEPYVTPKDLPERPEHRTHGCPRATGDLQLRASRTAGVPGQQMDVFIEAPQAPAGAGRQP